MLKPSEVKNTLNSLKTVKSNTQESLKCPKKTKKDPALQQTLQITEPVTQKCQVIVLKIRETCHENIRSDVFLN